MLRLLWKLIYHSRRLRLRVYRVIKEEAGIVVWSIVYEDVERKLFISNFSASERSEYIDFDVSSICDVRQAILGLSDVPQLMNRERWRVFGANSIEEAVDNWHAFAIKLRKTRANSKYGEEAPLKEGTLLAHAIVIEDKSEDSGNSHLDPRSGTVAKSQSQQRFRWAPFETTANGYQCQILLIDGKDEHQIP